MFEFSTEFAYLYTALFIIISLLTALYFYRKIAIRNWKKYLLIFFRSAAVFLLLEIFLQPVLLSFHGKGNNGINAVLIDNSRSMQRYDSVTKELYKKLSDAGKDISVFSFANNIEVPPADSFYSSGPYTNLSGSLEQLKILQENSPFNSITIISDGNFNLGGNPVYTAKTFGCPFLTVPAGDSVQQKDIVVYNAAYNKTAFINTATRVKIFFKAFKTGNENISLRLEKENNIINEKQVLLKPEENNYSADFDITENSPGKYKYRVTASSARGELTGKNNYYDFYIEFLDNKIRLLFVSGGPSYDNAVVSSIVKRFNNFETTVKTLKSATEFYEGNIDGGLYKDLSAIMLLNFPTIKYSGKDLDEIYANSKKYNIPVVFFAGKNTDYKKLDILSDFVPFSFTQSSAEKNVKLQVISAADDNISFDLGSTPDLFKNISAVMPKPGTTSIITDKYSGEPVLLLRKSGNMTSAAFLAYGFWQWKLKNNNEKQIEELIEKSIKISLNKNKNRKFIVSPEKEFFDYTEDAVINAEVFDENNIPAVNAVVKGTIKEKNGQKVKDIDFKYLNGKYSTNAGKLKIGDYIIDATAELNGTYYANDINRFSVDTINTEYLQTTVDYDILKELSGNTGGKIVQKNDLTEAISSIQNTNNITKTDIFKRINLRENSPFLILIIFLFTAEWVMKKRNNIP